VSSVQREESHAAMEIGEFRLASCSWSAELFDALLRARPGDVRRCPLNVIISHGKQKAAQNSGL
jgi:hypothetical protein